ncbi:MAG: polysaccharide deacetylase family protein [Treponema sp.]|nr:polysaccharide deacetylase family protein [Treponema sp.]
MNKIKMKYFLNGVYKSRFLFFILFILIISNISAVSFQDINLSNDDRLLYRSDFEDQNAVFISMLTDMSIQQLTAFPEKMYMVDNGRTIITLNRFGAAKIPVIGGLPSPIAGYPSFTTGSIPLSGKLQEISASADGRWILFIDLISPGYGNLVLVDSSNGTKQIVSEKIELPSSDFPAKWSPDSRFFVYSKNGLLYYFPINNNLSSLVSERFRLIGEGRINSVLWGQQGEFYYLTGNTLYRVINPELFTRTMYGDFLSIGNVTSVLPMDFNSSFDRYWISPDSESILINKGGKGFFFFFLGENQYNSAALPHFALPYGVNNFNVFWSSKRFTDGNSRTQTGYALTVIYSLRNEIKIRRFEIIGNTIKFIEELTNENGAVKQDRTPLSSIGAMSPDGTKIVFWGERGLELWDYSEWQLIQVLSETSVLSCVWANNRQLITGNSRFIEEITISNPAYPRRRICLSGADEIGFEESAQQVRGTTSTLRVLARLGTTWFATDGKNAWANVSNVQLRPISFSSDRYRVFLESQSQGPFKNIPMLRNLQSYGTISPFSLHTTGKVFAQERQIQIALCFDLYDDDTGLAQVLAALRRYNIRATFFLNGEFIRRNPRATIAIVEAGHETASLFYAPIDLSDTRYRITESFIAQGLARNEDEFNRVTGRELSIIWHPPFFRTSALINAAAVKAGYFTATRTIDTGDWLSRDESLRLNLRQAPPSEMIEQIINRKTQGAVIPVRIGLLSGGRDEYLFQHIEVLLDALIRSGCEIVPVSAVIRTVR